MVVGALGLGDRYLLHYPPHAAIDLINRPSDFAPVAQRAAFYDWLKAQGGDVDENHIIELIDERLPKAVDGRLREVMRARLRLIHLATDSDAAKVEDAIQILSENGVQV